MVVFDLLVYTVQFSTESGWPCVSNGWHMDCSWTGGQPTMWLHWVAYAMHAQVNGDGYTQGIKKRPVIIIIHCNNNNT